jgi:inner membrane protein
MNTNLSITVKGENLMVKTILTGLLILAMLIPAVYVQHLVEERKQRQQEVVKEVSGKWANSQTIAGPYLLVPVTSFAGNGNEPAKLLVTKIMVLLPTHLRVSGELTPELRRRGIYKVALYNSRLQLDGHFDLNSVKPVAGETIEWEKAALCLGITDTRGISTQVAANWNGQPLAFDAGVPAGGLASMGLSQQVPINASELDRPVSFSIPLQLKGSESLMLLPLGKTTEWQLQSTWPSPSFTGKFLPGFTSNTSGFKANWKVLHFNRDFPQVWKGETFKADAYAFGVSLLQPADHYAKTMRSVKYAILFIGLMFGFFFLLEILLGYRVHPVQYLLIGIALVVFYCLLLSIGEILAFNISYAIATLATVALITAYCRHLFGTIKNALLIGGFLGGLYGFIYVLIQLEDTALLVGSIGLFVLLALAMQLSRRITWYETTKPVKAHSD